MFFRINKKVSPSQQRTKLVELGLQKGPKKYREVFRTGNGNIDDKNAFWKFIKQTKISIYWKTINEAANAKDAFRKAK